MFPPPNKQKPNFSQAKKELLAIQRIAGSNRIKMYAKVKVYEISGANDDEWSLLCSGVLLLTHNISHEAFYLQIAELEISKIHLKQNVKKITYDSEHSTFHQILCEESLFGIHFDDPNEASNFGAKINEIINGSVCASDTTNDIEESATSETTTCLEQDKRNLCNELMGRKQSFKQPPKANVVTHITEDAIIASIMEMMGITLTDVGTHERMEKFLSVIEKGGGKEKWLRKLEKKKNKSKREENKNKIYVSSHNKMQNGHLHDAITQRGPLRETSTNVTTAHQKSKSKTSDFNAALKQTKNDNNQTEQELFLDRSNKNAQLLREIMKMMNITASELSSCKRVELFLNFVKENGGELKWHRRLEKKQKKQKLIDEKPKIQKLPSSSVSDVSNSAVKTPSMTKPEPSSSPLQKRRQNPPIVPRPSVKVPIPAPPQKKKPLFPTENKNLLQASVQDTGSDMNDMLAQIRNKCYDKLKKIQPPSEIKKPKGEASGGHHIMKSLDRYFEQRRSAIRGSDESEEEEEVDDDDHYWQSSF